MKKKYLSPIETHYNDLRFRSRLEARWAIFFDTLSIPYFYEPEGYHLGTMGNYLPDFWLPKHSIWIEVKGRRPTPLEVNRMRALVTQSECPGVILWGDVTSKPQDGAHWSYLPTVSGNPIHSTNKTWFECPSCHRISILVRSCSCPNAQPDPASPTLLAAYRAARTARFEFGENGSKPKPRWRRNRA